MTPLIVINNSFPIRWRENSGQHFYLKFESLASYNLSRYCQYVVLLMLTFTKVAHVENAVLIFFVSLSRFHLLSVLTSILPVWQQPFFLTSVVTICFASCDRKRNWRSSCAACEINLVGMFMSSPFTTNWKSEHQKLEKTNKMVKA